MPIDDFLDPAQESRKLKKAQQRAWVSGGSTGGGAYSSRYNNSQSISSGVFTVVEWPELFSESGIGYSAGVFTVTSAGAYLVSTQVAFANNLSNSRTIRLRKNSSTMSTRASGVPVYQGGVEMAVALSLVQIVPCAAGDTISVQAYQNGAPTLSIAGGSSAPQTFVSIGRIA
jgi:hypothetical protein